jgi:SAM-dependent methyltransferase
MASSEVTREQYGDGVRLSARQALWTFRAGPSLYDTVLDLAELRGSEVVFDVGCGNGRYEAGLRQRGHTGPIVGLDLFEGMARAAGQHATTVVADAQALPLCDASGDVALNMHMLYHVPDIPRAIGELRRVIRRGGTVLVATNGTGHTYEAKALLAQAAYLVAGITIDHNWDAKRFRTGVARDLLADAFDHVEVHELGGAAVVPTPEIVSGYLASWSPESIGLHRGPMWAAVLAMADELIAEHFANHAVFTVTGRAAVLVCRP